STALHDRLCIQIESPSWRFEIRRWVCLSRAREASWPGKNTEAFFRLPEVCICYFDTPMTDGANACLSDIMKETEGSWLPKDLRISLGCYPSISGSDLRRLLLEVEDRYNFN